jgi:hypothetical protein
MSVYPALPPREPMHPVELPSWYDPANPEKTTEDASPLPPFKTCPECGMWLAHQSGCGYSGLSINDTWRRYKDKQKEQEGQEKQKNLD